MDASARPDQRTADRDPARAASLRNARLLLAPELAAGTLSPGALEAAAGAPVLRTRAVPPVPLRFAQLVQRRRGRMDYLRAVAEPLAEARRRALGEHAGGPPRFLVRIDEFPHYRAWDEPERYGTEAFRRFDAIMTAAGVPYLIALTPRVSRAPLDPHERTWRALEPGELELLGTLTGPRVTFALHGRDHRTRHAHPRRHSELTGLGDAAVAALLDGALAELEAAGAARPEVFVPPFNRFDAAQYALLAERFAIVCGGPETVGALGFHSTPSWRDAAVYMPSYFPLYARAREVLPAARELIAHHMALWAPITLHWGWEADEEWTALEQLARTIAPYAAEWEELLAPVRAERAVARPPTASGV